MGPEAYIVVGVLCGIALALIFENGRLRRESFRSREAYEERIQRLLDRQAARMGTPIALDQDRIYGERVTADGTIIPDSGPPRSPWDGPQGDAPGAEGGNR